MHEIVFDDGAAFVLCQAKATGEIPGVCCEISADRDGNIIAQTEFSPERYPGPYIAGDVSDVKCLWLVASMGDISGPGLGDRAEVYRMCAESNLTKDEDMTWTDECAEEIVKTADKLKASAECGEPIRVWYGDSEEEICGFYLLMHFLRDAGAELVRVKIPEGYKNAEGKPARSVRDLWPEDVCALEKTSHPVPEPERRRAAEVWEGLKKENAPLRAIIDGVPASVSEDYYDQALRSFFPDEEFAVALALGRALSEGPAGIRDFHYVSRIRHMLRTGELVQTGEHEHFHFRKIKKAVR